MSAYKIVGPDGPEVVLSGTPDEVARQLFRLFFPDLPEGGPDAVLVAGELAGITPQEERPMSAFDVWEKAVDHAILERYGISLYDLPDQPLADWFEAGMTPSAAVRMVAEAEELPDETDRRYDDDEEEGEEYDPDFDYLADDTGYYAFE